MRRSRGYLWWALLVLPLWLTLALCTHWEPVLHDGWTHIAWYRDHTLGVRSFYELCRGIYLFENPRLGQVFTLLLYARGPYHMIATPILELGVFALLTALALGRWPSARRTDDAFVALLVTAIVLACAPQIGLLLCYRAYTGNYTIGLALNLLWLMPYRLELAAPRPRRWLAPASFVVGIAAGLCNEHTGLAFLAMGGAASIACWRRGRLCGWMVAGLVGLAAGYVALLAAPGQQVRYGGIAAQAGIFERIADRGAAANLHIVVVLALAMVPALPLVAAGVVERWAGGPAALPATERWTHRVLAVAGLACTLTLLASPKLGARLYLASVALIAAGLAGWLGAQLRRTWIRTGCAVLAAGAVIFVEARLVAIHAVVGPLGVTRRDRIEHGAPGARVTVPEYPVPASRYFLGEDFSRREREGIAAGYGLASIELEPAGK